jgi:hypothetical protein
MSGCMSSIARSDSPTAAATRTPYPSARRLSARKAAVAASSSMTSTCVASMPV